MDSDRVWCWDDHDTFNRLPVLSSSPQHTDSLDDVFDQFIDYPAAETSPLTTPHSCLGCGTASLSSTGQSPFCDTCQLVSSLRVIMDQVESNDSLFQSAARSSSDGSDGTGPTPSEAGPDPYPRLANTIPTPEAHRGELPVLDWTPQYAIIGLGNRWPVQLADLEPIVEAGPVQQLQQPGGIQLVLDRNMNEVRQPGRRRYTADERAEVRQKRGLVCEKCRKNKRRCTHVSTNASPGRGTLWFGGLDGLDMMRMSMRSPLHLISRALRCSWDWNPYDLSFACIDPSQWYERLPWGAWGPALRELSVEQLKVLDYGVDYNSQVFSQTSYLGKAATRLFSWASYGRGSCWEILRQSIFRGPLSG